MLSCCLADNHLPNMDNTPAAYVPLKSHYHLDLIFSNLLYGINFSYFVSLVKHWVDFEDLFFLQIFVSAIFFIPFALFSRRYRLSWRDFATIFLVALLVIYGGMYMLLWGAKYTNPIDASTIATLGPAFTLIAASFIAQKKFFSWARFLGVMLCLVGAAMLLLDRGNVLIHGSEAYGNLLVLVSVICVAINTVIIKPVLEKLGTLVVMGWYYIIGFVITAPFFMENALHTDYFTIPFTAQLEILYVLILGTILPSYLLYKGTEKLTSVHTALYRYIQPVIATVLALWRGQETLDRTNIIAAALMFAGIVLVVTAYKGVVRKLRKILGDPAQNPSAPPPTSSLPPT